MLLFFELMHSLIPKPAPTFGDYAYFTRATGSSAEFSGSDEPSHTMHGCNHAIYSPERQLQFQGEFRAFFVQTEPLKML